MACRAPCDAGAALPLPRCQTLLFDFYKTIMSFTLSWWRNDQLLSKASQWLQLTPLYTALLCPPAIRSQPWAGFCPMILYFNLEHLLSNLEFWMLFCEICHCRFYSSCSRDCSFWLTHNTVTGDLSPTPRAHLGSRRTVFTLLSVLWVHIYDLNSSSPCIALKVIFKMWEACLP